MIHLVGDLIIDEYWHGETTRISPENIPAPIIESPLTLTKYVDLGFLIM